MPNDNPFACECYFQSSAKKSNLGHRKRGLQKLHSSDIQQI
ncbi:hypothetical protein HanHA89_Chr08g0309801 [Helianthus annuus]|nr:hypothetical protein HanHA89_Chr08g0309801 [Helianthus annuus]